MLYRVGEAAKRIRLFIMMVLDPTRRTFQIKEEYQVLQAEVGAFKSLNLCLVACMCTICLIILRSHVIECQ